MKYIFVPISIIGCGKSTTFRILTQLYPNWAHVENDDCKSKREFLGKITSALQSHDVVLLDRNNHLKLHREQIVEAYKKPGVMLVALEFVDSSLDRSRLRSVTFDRVEKRGDNHQTIASSTQKGLARSIMSRFINEFCPLEKTGADAQFDHRIKMDIGPVSSMANAERILEYLHSVDASKVPQVATKAVLRQSFEHSLAYKAKQNHSERKEAKVTKRGDKGQAKVTRWTKAANGEVSGANRNK